MKGRFNRFVRFFKPEITIIKTDKDKDKRIEDFVKKETQWEIQKQQWIDERSKLIQQIRDLNRRVEGYEIKIERLTDAVYMMIGSIDLDPAVKRQVEAKLKV